MMYELIVVHLLLLLSLLLPYLSWYIMASSENKMAAQHTFSN
jgi:hypothetical protein